MKIQQLNAVCKMAGLSPKQTLDVQDDLAGGSTHNEQTRRVLLLCIMLDDLQTKNGNCAKPPLGGLIEGWDAERKNLLWGGVETCVWVDKAPTNNGNNSDTFAINVCCECQPPTIKQINEFKAQLIITGTWEYEQLLNRMFELFYEHISI